MILRMPEYCKNFKCIAGKCIDSCCRDGWEIDVDLETEDYYKTIGGEFGEKLRSNISGGCLVLDENGCCPFLNHEGLCDIILTLGEDSICQICSEHPRYYEWFGDHAEGGIGMCCEEAARIILSWNKPFAFWDREVPDDEWSDYDEELYEFLLSARAKIIRHLQDRNIPLKKRIADIVEYADKLQYNADNYDYSDTEIRSAVRFENNEFKAVLDFFTTLEPMGETWIPFLKSRILDLEKVRGFKREFEIQNPEVQIYLENIAVYFVWRYFMKGTFDGEFLSRIKLMAESVAVIGYLFCCECLESGGISLEKCVELAKNYSKEIEYSEENLDALADASYDLECFETKKISGLFA